MPPMPRPYQPQRVKVTWIEPVTWEYRATSWILGGFLAGMLFCGVIYIMVLVFGG